MKIGIATILLIITTEYCYGQNLNMVIQVNEKLVTSEISGVSLNFESIDGTKTKTIVGYHLGELILENEIWSNINSNSTKKITLTIDYNTFDGNKHQIRNYRVDMEKYHFYQPYLILYVYDFSDRKYRKQYGCLTDNDFIAELYFPQGGVLIKCDD